MSRFEDLTVAQIDLIRASLLHRQYYLLAGSGISLDSEGSAGVMKSSPSLRTVLCEHLKIPPTRSLQQAYSLLNANEVETFLTAPYKCVTPGPTAAKLASYQWKRIFTFNIDDCFETSVAKLLAGRVDFAEKIEIKNYSDDFSDFSPLKAQSVVHLHGLVTQSHNGYVFSHAEYAKNITRPNSWMLTLVQLIRGEPFIVVGTSLDEIDVTYYLEQRNENSVRPDIAPSIMIEPYPDRLTEKLCEQHQLFLFKGTALEFFSALELSFGAPPPYWDAATPQYLSSIFIEKKYKVAFEATFEAIPRQVVPDRRVGPFLLGAPITWSTIEARADIPRCIGQHSRKVARVN